ncbi:response regulator receiver protein [Stanieria cyanosphaera PCC 7437]|uniref:Response regulator receiver protein n=1 Tax=Stanieria cyanosphaera (strain ATCC 29371 / PCC 7437) TaxID=111780 RepID=K9XRX7_STAC7|nr:response regulator [Stanieria cyanosphaera]AFZ35278.1 response regulator receiver protein [Stanieria cyanosphaera PCC 7437]
MIKILIVDDQKFVRARLECLVNSISDFKLIGLANNGLDAIAFAKELHPDIVLLDLEMPQLNGLVTTKLIAEECPETKILVLSSHDEDKYVTESMSAGATGYLLKGSSDEEIEQAIRFVNKGFTHMGAGLFEKLLPVVKKSTVDSLEHKQNNLDSHSQVLLQRKAKLTSTSLTKEEIVLTSPNPIAIESQPWTTQNSLKQTLAWLIVALSLTTGIYVMRQWLRKPLPVLSYEEQSATIAQTQFTGKVKPAKTFKIAAINPGVVDQISVQVGEKVEVGQTLLTLKNLAAENEQKQIIQEQQSTKQQQQAVFQQQQIAQQQIFDLEQKINRLKYDLAPLRAKIAEANLQVSLAQSQAEKLPLRQRQDSVPRTKAVYERAKARFNRLDTLNQQGAISQEQLEQAQVELEIAKADYDTAIAAANANTKLEQSQTELSQLQEKLAIQEQQDAIAQLEKQKQKAQLEYQQATEKLELLKQQAAQLNQYQIPQINQVITATEAGIITEIPVTIGDQIYGGNAVIGLARLEQLKIEVAVNSRLINVLSPNQPAVIQIGSGVTAQKFEGKIATVNPLPTEKLDYLVEIEFANPTNSLIISQLAQVQFLPQTVMGGK